MVVIDRNVSRCHHKVRNARLFETGASNLFLCLTASADHRLVQGVKGESDRPGTTRSVDRKARKVGNALEGGYPQDHCLYFPKEPLPPGGAPL